jgi:hypothetical protein
MDELIEARLGMSLDDLIKEQKQNAASAAKRLPTKKKPVPAKGGNAKVRIITTDVKLLCCVVTLKIILALLF